MKSTGIIRKMDELGRIVVPVEIRNQFEMVEGDPIEIYVDRDLVILKKYNPNCIFCGEENNLIEYKNQLICKKCQKNIININ